MSIFLEAGFGFPSVPKIPPYTYPMKNRNRFCRVYYTEVCNTIYVSVGAIATDGLTSSISLRQTIFGMKLIMIATEEWAFNQLPQHFLQAF